MASACRTLLGAVERANRMKDKRQFEPFKEPARESGADNLPDMFDKIIGEMGRNACFHLAKGVALQWRSPKLLPPIIQPTKSGCLGAGSAA